LIGGGEAARYADFLCATLPALAAAPLARGRFGCLDAALAAAPREGAGVELGVWKGRSLRRAARRQPWRHFHGFDSLAGFPEDGRPDWRLDFRVAAPPRLPRNCTFHAGFFAATVPAFAAAHRAPIAFVNLDCDILTAADEALSALAPLLVPGTALHLDEAVNYDTWPWNEMLALFRLLDARGLDLRWIARAGRVRDLPTTLHFLEREAYPRWEDDVAAGFARQAAGVLVAREAPWPAAPPGVAGRLASRSAAHWARTQQRRPCHPEDCTAPPPPPRPAWRRWLGL
jgi:hypothetical protein